MSRSVPAEPPNESDPTRSSSSRCITTQSIDPPCRIHCARLRAGAVVRARTGNTRQRQRSSNAHGLREVAAWPIGLLGIHCVVYELPAGVDRNAALERLRHDSRVGAAQPYQSFSTLTNEAGTISASDPYRRCSGTWI